MSDEAEKKPEEAPAAAPKAVKKPVLFGVAGGLFAVGTAMGMFVVGPMINGSKGEAKAAEEEHAPAADGHGAAPADGGAGPTYLFENIVLNPAGSNGSRFLLVAAAVEVSDAALVEAIRGRDAEARDLLSSVLGAHTVERLSDLSLRDTLRADIARVLNEMVKQPNAVRRVHFPQFVVQ